MNKSFQLLNPGGSFVFDSLFTGYPLKTCPHVSKVVNLPAGKQGCKLSVKAVEGSV